MRKIISVILFFFPLTYFAQVTDRIDMMDMSNVAYQGFFYAGGEYVREGDQVTMGGAMYVEVMVTEEI